MCVLSHLNKDYLLTYLHMSDLRERLSCSDWTPQPPPHLSSTQHFKLNKSRRHLRLRRTNIIMIMLLSWSLGGRKCSLISAIDYTRAFRRRRRRRRKCNDLKCVRKPTKSRLSLTHHLGYKHKGRETARH